jgi:hypothetical protein
VWVPHRPCGGRSPGHNDLDPFWARLAEARVPSVFFTPYVYEDVGDLIRQSDSRLYLFSSDYPHTEGGRHPLERFQATLSGFDEAAQARFYSGNFARLFGIAAWGVASPAHPRIPGEESRRLRTSRTAENCEMSDVTLAGAAR